MASLSEAFPAPNNDAKLFETTENPQTYNEFTASVRHVKEARHVLGVVGGNEVSRAAGNQTDVESDLLGITRPNTWGTARKHLPPSSDKVHRTTAKGTFQVDATPVNLPVYQMWAYPSVIGPEPLENQVCMKPEKY